MDTPRVSVCVPIYNGARYLDACLSGIAAQTFTDFEVLIVDDCSRDESLEIANRWARADPRFKVHVNPKNRGLVGNWNRSIELARGEWIKFLFQDDLIEPTCLEEMLKVGEGGSGFVACSRALLIEGKLEPALEAFYAEHPRTLARIFSSAVHMSAYDYCRAKLDHLEINIVGEPSVTLIRRDLFERFGPFDAMLVQMCDSEMWTRLASNVGLEFIQKDLVTFRVHGASASEANRKRPFRGTILDGIVETTKFCESPQFERLREHARRAGRFTELRDALNTQIHIAFYMMRDAERGKTRDPKIREELRTLLDQLTGFRRARNMHLRFRFKRMLGLVEPVP